MFYNYWLIILTLLLCLCKKYYCQIFHSLCSVEGDVGRENFSYYDIHYRGNIILLLNSIKGDADMYISRSGVLPTYDPKTFDYHSATCGEDFIEIPYGFSSPITAGIYGYSTGESNKFTLNVYKNPFNSSDESSAFCLIEDKDKRLEGKTEVKKKRKLKNNAAKISGIFSLLEILQLIFT